MKDNFSNNCMKTSDVALFRQKKPMGEIIVNSWSDLVKHFNIS